MPSNRYILALFITLFININDSTAQQIKVDSLLKALKYASEDTNKVNLLNKLYTEYQTNVPTKAIFYAKKALELSEKLGFQRGEAASYNNIGRAFFLDNKSSDALDYYLKALEIFTDIGYKKGASIVLANIGQLFYSQGNYAKTLEYYFQALALTNEINDQQRTASLLGNIGTVYYHQGYYAKSLKYYLHSLSIREAISDKQGIAYVLGNIGVIYDEQKNYEKSLEYYNKSLAINQEIGDKKEIANTLSNIGEIYNNQKDYKKALEYFQKAFTIASDLEYKQVMASSLNNIGDVYKKQARYSKALEYYSQALIINQQTSDKKGITYSYNNIGVIYMKNGDFENALVYFNKSLESAKEMGAKDLIKENYLKISEMYAEGKNYENAFLYYKLYSELKDSIYSEESIQLITDMQTKYETAQKEKEIKLLKKDSEVKNLRINRNNIILFALAACFILLAVLALFIFFNYRHRQRVKQLNAEIALKQSEEKYRDLANLLPQIMFEVADDNKFTFINTAGLELTQYSNEDVSKGIHITDIFGNDEKEKFLSNLKIVNMGIASKGREYLARRKDGSVFPVLCYFSAATDNNKGGFRGIANDITEHKQIERRILNKIVEAEEKERKRVAKDLHDGLGPLLSSIKLYVNEISSDDTDEKEKKDMLQYTNELIDDAVSSTRTIANNLMPGILAHYGLIKALKSFCDKLNISKSVNLTFTANDIEKRYDTTVEITLYRILMEIIHNALKHAAAANIIINLQERAGILQIECSDDGKGFDVETTLANPEIGMGLNNIINRVKSIQGDCEFISKQGEGTKVKIEIYLNKI